MAAPKRDYFPGLNQVGDLNLQSILHRVVDALAQSKEDATKIATAAAASTTEIAALTSRIETLEGQIRSLIYTGFRDYTLIADPPAPGKNIGREYTRDNGSGKVQLAVRFPTGAVQVLATEP